VRHGHLPEREIMTGIGPVTVRQPRVRDREAAEGERIWYSPSIVPPYARRSKSLEVLIPVLYLKGISTGDFEQALAALVGNDAPGLSASTIARLKEAWSEEHARWQKRDLSAKRYVYCWADGIHLEARLEEQAQCILVIIGATPEGRKELVGFTDGIRESSRAAVLQVRIHLPPAESLVRTEEREGKLYAIKSTRTEQLSRVPPSDSPSPPAIPPHRS
jgi:putative transposase